MTTERPTLDLSAQELILSPSLYNTEDMAVTVEMHNTGDAQTSREIVAVIEHMLSDKPGVWRVSLAGSRASDNWEMKVEGPKGFERSYTLLGSAEQHQPQVIASVLLKLLPANTG